MIKVMAGDRGSGKTKTLIDNVNSASAVSNGHVVCLEWGDKLRFDISCHVRLVDVQEYGISSAQKLYGFITGILASNYDVTDLFIDSALKMCGEDADTQKALVEVLDKVAPMIEEHGVKCFITASVPVEKIIPELLAYTK